MTAKSNLPPSGWNPLLSEIHRHGDLLADAAEKFLQQMDALENPRPAQSWFDLKDAIKAYRKVAK